MHPLLMDAVITARQEELRRAAHQSHLGRRGSPTRSVIRRATAATFGGRGRGTGEDR